MNTDTIICNLYETRTKLGYTQHQVAEGTSISVRTLINIEKGKTLPSLLYAMKLANFLDQPVDELFEYRNAG